MTYTAPQNTDLLLSEAQKETLYTKLIEQLNKDFTLANELLNFSSDISPIDLKLGLRDKLYALIQHRFAEYLNVLYIVDVPEREIKALSGADILELSEQVTFLILKREWQKVWFRNRY